MSCDGKMIGSIPAAGATTETLAQMMVGREVTLKVNKQPARPGEVALEAEAAVGREAVGAGVDHPAGGVEADEPVPDPR